MFTKKNNNALPQSGGVETDSQYIKTMKQDLLSGNNPSFGAPSNNTSNQNISSSVNNPVSYSTTPQSQESSNPVAQSPQSSSPFLGSNSFQEPPLNTQVSPSRETVLPESNTVGEKFQEPVLSSNSYPPKANIIPSSELVSSVATKNNQGNSGSKILIIIILILIILSLIGGGYFFWATRSTQQPVDAIVDDKTVPITTPEPPVTINPLTNKFSLTNPNILTIDTNSTTAADIKNLLQSTAKEILTANPTQPVEFIITDSNNAPIAFHIFVSLTNIDLPKTLLSGLDEKFSLFYFVDSGKAHMGAQIASKNKIATLAEMKNAENTLSKGLSIFFLEDLTQTNSIVFKDGSYNNIATRYGNIDLAQNLSIDYTVNDNFIIFGTSKNTLRSIIDKTANTASSDSSPK